MKPIPTSVHGMLDYPVGLLLLAAPNLFGFADQGGAAVLVPRLIGVIVIVQSLMTRYEAGVIKVLPMKIHLMNDYLAGALLLFSPWLFGFADSPVNVWVPHVAAGLVVLIKKMPGKL
ncbi:SPW repeat-containing protein [Prosthecobacter fusiformis]|uniref:SPW repeat-containing protein n=1 Tax=Prosthecobacter fusiformis TaxID=48464 RepID=A0A4R7S418_9BACT|nr:SPW repeat protein [Prosthecobacter fusiformis]TDU73152.1 SPW repeat-containing protein [Prosthecobacter fusiformis]